MRGLPLWFGDCVFSQWLKKQCRVPRLLKVHRLLVAAPTGNAVVLLVDFNSHTGTNSETWRGVIGRNGLPDMGPTGVLWLGFYTSHSLSIINNMFKHKCVYQFMWHLLLDFNVSHSLSIMNTVFKHKYVHHCMWHQAPLSHRIMINFADASSDLCLYVLETWIKGIRLIIT